MQKVRTVFQISTLLFVAASLLHCGYPQDNSYSEYSQPSDVRSSDRVVKCDRNSPLKSRREACKKAKLSLKQQPGGLSKQYSRP